MDDVKLVAYSQKELDTRIEDSIKRGYKVKRQGNNFTQWDRNKFYAVLEKDKELTK